MDPWTSGLSPSLWTVTYQGSGNSATASGGVLTLTPAPVSNAGVFVMSASHYALRDSQVTVNLKQVTNSGKGVDTKFIVMRPDDLWNEEIGFWYERGLLYCYVMDQGNWVATTTLTYAPLTHAWLRIRETAGTIYLETSPDGSAWTTQLTTPDATAANTDLGDVILDFEAKEHSTPNTSPGSAKFAGLNTR